MATACAPRAATPAASDAAAAGRGSTDAPPRQDEAAAEREAAEREARLRARDWLALVDGGRYAESWDMAADIFRATTSREQWQRAAERTRTPLGDLTQRQFRAAQYAPSLSGAPKGEYVIVHYDTTFAHKPSAREIVTLSLGPDDSWKVAGYFIQ